MRYDKLILKATIMFATIWLIIRTADKLIDGPITNTYWRRIKGARR